MAGRVTFKYLGALFGGGQSQIRAEIETALADLNKLTAIDHWNCNHLKLLAGRLCALQQIQFTLRTTQLEIAAKLGADVDQWLLTHFISDLTDVPYDVLSTNETATAITHLPMKRGGLGYLSQERTSPYAYAASLGMARAVMASRATDMIDLGFEDPGPMLNAQRSAGVPEVTTLLAALPDFDESSFWESESASTFKGLQSKAMDKWASKKWLDTFLTFSTKAEQWRFVDMDSTLSRAWMYNIPTCAANTLCNEAVSNYLRLKIHVPMQPFLPSNSVTSRSACDYCSNTHLTDDRPNIIHISAEHPLVCKRRESYDGRQNRHKQLKRELMRQFYMAGCKGRLERPCGSGRKMDITILEGTPYSALYLDVTSSSLRTQVCLQNSITKMELDMAAAQIREDTLNKSKAAKATNGTGTSKEPVDFNAIMFPMKTAARKLLLEPLFKTMEDHKYVKYGDLTNADESTLFMPVAISAYGTPSPKMEQILKGLAEREFNGTSRTESSILSRVYRDISIMWNTALHKLYSIGTYPLTSF